ncbi:MAG: OadG family protein [Prevotellaceae bacterium]|jgi:Na+-transporting methylmalonyl-CoA/oxaloacetate decarboxylase gamma subunit|nr:OadG family protein [Prevotellaceae bacterium]
MLILTVNWTNAFIITFLGLTLVFIVLCLLIGLLHIFGIVTNKLSGEQKGTRAKKEDEQYSEAVFEAENAAISMALHLYYADVHDEESDIITIKNINYRYSPWNAKKH